MLARNDNGSTQEQTAVDEATRSGSDNSVRAVLYVDTIERAAFNLT